MKQDERVKAIKERYEQLKTTDGLRNSRQRTDISSNKSIETARNILKQHMKDGKTTVPISFKEYESEFNVSKKSLNHYRDKMLRIFEVAIITENGMEDLKNFEIQGFPYGKTNTELIRKHIERGYNTVLTENASDETDIFLTVNIAESPKVEN